MVGCVIVRDGEIVGELSRPELFCEGTCHLRRLRREERVEPSEANTDFPCGAEQNQRSGSARGARGEGAHESSLPG